MSKPLLHAKSSARKHGGKWEDYIDIHEFMDSSKSVIADGRHRALSHNTWFISFVIPKIFGEVRVNSDDKEYSVRDICEEHCAEDFRGFVPAASDYLVSMPLEGWMNNGAGTPPPSVQAYRTTRTD